MAKFQSLTIVQQRLEAEFGKNAPKKGLQYSNAFMKLVRTEM